ncbi:hypothetical protein E2C01_075390 [Portunus trituberculatus]|uniref:Uncharacterized protein n=1 Tax=Portunus trituberculatus TaxID=210409 RepID=A0A5B7IGY3_PORTR|nr:hypothetical protein [Portunus trituberculatus]
MNGKQVPGRGSHAYPAPRCVVRCAAMLRRLGGERSVDRGGGLGQPCTTRSGNVSGSTTQHNTAQRTSRTT